MSTVKLEGWKPQQIPLEGEELEALQQLCVIAVQRIWVRHHRPASLREIYLIVKDTLELGGLIGGDFWRFKYFYSKRTVDRRVNEAASGDNPKIVAVTAGYYLPNPERRGV